MRPTRKSPQPHPTLRTPRAGPTPDPARGLAYQAAQTFDLLAAATRSLGKDQETPPAQFSNFLDVLSAVTQDRATARPKREAF